VSIHGDPWGTSGYLQDYRPYWAPDHTPNPAFRRPDDALILDLKDGFSGGIEFARDQFLAASQELGLAVGTLLVIVPGHEAAETNVGRPLARVAQSLANWNGALTPVVDALIRHQTIEKLASGGKRDLALQLISMRVPRPEETRDRDVLLIDDVTTTGNSLLAGRQLLQKAGARRIAALALAQTAR
jgi:predicted amidophosphoribosyltransferase